MQKLPEMAPRADQWKGCDTMKRLIASFLLLASNMANAEQKPASLPAYQPEPAVEQKVVEIHMTAVSPLAAQDARRKRPKTNQVPLPGHGTCSGAFIDSVGDIITARHCVEGFDSFEVVTFDQRRYTAVVVATSTIHDLALVHIDRRDTAHFAPAQKVERGEPISVLGSPLGITDTLSRGVVARLDGDVTLIDCSVLPGNSGGPVFDADGRLVGIVTAGYVVLFGMTHLNIAQSVDAIWFFLASAFARR